MDTPIFAIAGNGFDKKYMHVNRKDLQISATWMVSHFPSRKQIIDILCIVCHIKTSIIGLT